MMKVGAIIQARMGSSRLPGKVLMKLPPGGQRDILGHIILRASQVVEVRVATSLGKEDDTIARSYPGVFRGSENDVLQRYFQCAQEMGLDQVIRLTGDNPLIDPKVIRDVLDQHIRVNADYTISTGLPLGCNIEVFKFSALERSVEQASDPLDREHVTRYMKNHPLDFTLNEVHYNYRHTIRLTLDYPSDLELMEVIFSRLGEDVSLDKLADYLDEHPELILINKDNKQLS